jgi:hypothetical protein
VGFVIKITDLRIADFVDQITVPDCEDSASTTV